ncbi:MGMT family protein [Myxococcota bacterium]|nr:MGMT family protein [Myxococcota bacterium]
MSNFRARVYDLVLQIPPGKVLAYGDVAGALGAPGAARQVGYAMAALGPGGLDKLGRAVPWQRVILSTGHVALRGDPVRGPVQRQLLEAEGVVFEGDRVDLWRFRWDLRDVHLV